MYRKCQKSIKIAKPVNSVGKTKTTRVIDTALLLTTEYSSTTTEIWRESVKQRNLSANVVVSAGICPKTITNHENFPSRGKESRRLSGN